MTSPVTILKQRPKLLTAIAVGLAVGVGLAFLPGGPDAGTGAVIGWDALCVWFIAASLWSMRQADGAVMREQAAKQDEGRHAILAVMVIATAVGFAGVGAQFSMAKDAAAGIKTLRIGLAVSTVALSWFLMQLVFALHYAHEFYGAPEGKPARGKTVRGGLAFPGEGEPDYWDFLHFSTVIGVACQTADIAFTSRTTRRLGTGHGIIAFVFNTAVLALTINLAAGLFG